MGCVFTRICPPEDLYREELKQGQLSQKKAIKSRIFLDGKLGKNEAEPRDCVYYGGGIPGVALTADRVDLVEFTGARESGYISVSGKLKWGAHSRAGTDPLQRRKENQDSFCVCDALVDEAHLTFFSVFDGHGPQGAFASHFVRQAFHESLADAYVDLMQRMSAASRKARISTDIISEAFKRAAQDVTLKLTTSGIDLRVSGTTATGLLVCEEDIFLVNLGDSRVVIAVYDETNKTYAFQCETRDHKPDIPEEQERIEANNGRVFEWGSHRVWLKDVDMPGLAMSRSFGDSVAKTVGVTSDPDIIIVDKIPFGNKIHPSFAILASDGIWEFMTTDDCISFISDCILENKMTPQETCNAVVNEALDRWYTEEDVVDDITAVVVYF